MFPKGHNPRLHLVLQLSEYYNAPSYYYCYYYIYYIYYILLPLLLLLLLRLLLRLISATAPATPYNDCGYNTHQDKCSCHYIQKLQKDNKRVVATANTDSPVMTAQLRNGSLMSVTSMVGSNDSSSTGRTLCVDIGAAPVEVCCLDLVGPNVHSFATLRG